MARDVAGLPRMLVRGFGRPFGAGRILMRCFPGLRPLRGLVLGYSRLPLRGNYSLGWCSRGMSGWLVQRQLGHGVVVAFGGPEGGLILDGGGGHQRLGEGDSVALVVLAKELSGEVAYLIVD